MKSILSRVAIALTSFFTFLGMVKTKDIEPKETQKSRVGKQRVVVLDEHEFSAFHSN